MWARRVSWNVLGRLYQGNGGLVDTVSPFRRDLGRQQEGNGDAFNSVRLSIVDNTLASVMDGIWDQLLIIWILRMIFDPRYQTLVGCAKAMFTTINERHWFKYAEYLEALASHKWMGLLHCFNELWRML